MVKIGKIRSFLYKISDLAIVITTTLIGIMSFINDIKDTDSWIENKPNQWHFVEWIQGYSIYFFIALFLVFAFFSIVKKMKNPWIWEQIQFILDQYQDKVFNEFSVDPTDHNRVTLFKLEKNCFF